MKLILVLIGIVVAYFIYQKFYGTEGFLYPEASSMPFGYNSLPPEIWRRIYASTVGDINPHVFECQNCQGVLNR